MQEAQRPGSSLSSLPGTTSQEQFKSFTEVVLGKNSRKKTN